MGSFSEGVTAGLRKKELAFAARQAAREDALEKDKRFFTERDALTEQALKTKTELTGAGIDPSEIEAAINPFRQQLISLSQTRARFRFGTSTLSPDAEAQQQIDRFNAMLGRGVTPTERGIAAGRENVGELAGQLGRAPTETERGRLAGKPNLQTVNFRDAQGNLVTATFDPETGRVGAEIGRGPSVQFQPPQLPSSAIEGFAEAEVSTRTALAELDRVQEQIGEADTFSGAVGTLTTGLAGAVGAAQQAAALFGADDTALLQGDYDFSGFTGPGANTAAFRSNILNLAYLLARAAEPGGRLSDRDVQVQIKRLSANSGSKESINAALEEVRRGTKQAFAVRHGVFSRFTQIGPLPKDLEPDGEKAPEGGLKASDHPEGTTATGPGGKKMIVRDGKWVPQ